MKKYKHTRNSIGVHFVSFDDKHILLGTFADSDGADSIVDELNRLDSDLEDCLDANVRCQNELSATQREFRQYRKKVAKVLSEKLTRARSLYIEATPNAPTEHNRWVDAEVICEIISELGIEYD